MPSSNTNTITLAAALASLLDSLADDLEQVMPLGLDPIDQVIGGIGLGDVCVLAGRPGMGKSAIALQCALVNWNSGVTFISLEMGDKQLAKRALQRVTDRDIATANIQDLAEDAKELFVIGEQIVIADPPDRRIRTILGAMQDAKDRGHKLVVIDYLQQVRGEGDIPYAQVSNASQEIKQFARHNELGVLLLAQLSREVEKRNDGRPRMSDLRDSGQIEQDADQVVLVWRPSEYGSGNPEDLLIVVPKSRHTAPINVPVKMIWSGRKQTVVSDEPDRWEAFDRFNEGAFN